MKRVFFQRIKISRAELRRPIIEFHFASLLSFAALWMVLACPSKSRAVDAGWDRVVEVRLEGFDECYVSASIAGSMYSGGAHPFEDFATFNWNVKAERAVENTDLFRTDTDWKSAIFALYRQHRQQGGTDLSEWELSEDGKNSLFSNGFVITESGLRFVQHPGATRNAVVPAIELGWRELAPWLVPRSCS